VSFGYTAFPVELCQLVRWSRKKEQGYFRTKQWTLRQEGAV